VKAFIILLFLPPFNYHFLHSLDLCPSCMKPPINFRFEVVHLQINVWFLPLANLVFDEICCPFVKIDLKSMFQRSLYDYISRLQFIGTICRNKHNNNVKVFFFYLIKKFFTLVNASTIDYSYKFLVFL
jgi:hypothetical protein